MKLGMALSLLANVALVIALAAEAKKVVQAKQEIAQVNEELTKAIKGIAQVGFMAGCLKAYADSTGESGPQNPLWPILQEACSQAGANFADTIKLSETK